MSLLPTVNAASVGAAPNYYFALAGDNSVISAAGFTSTENGFTVSDGANFTAKAEVAAGVNADALTIVEGGGLKRWTVGVANAEAGMNTGSDLVVKRYDDTGALLGTPLTISRNTGNVSMTGALTVGGNAVVSGTLTGPTNILYANTAPLVSAAFTAPNPPAAGFTETVVSTFTPPRTGLYLATFSYGVDANITDGYTAAPPDNIGWTLRPNVPPPYPVDSIVAVGAPVYSVAPGADNDYGFNSSFVGRLVGGIEYNIIAVVDNISGTMTGPAPLATILKVVPLC